jgi:hypothetical protein
MLESIDVISDELRALIAQQCPPAGKDQTDKGPPRGPYNTKSSAATNVTTPMRIVARNRLGMSVNRRM